MQADWFAVAPQQCGIAGDWDSDPSTVFSRTLLPLLFIACAATIVVLARCVRHGRHAEDGTATSTRQPEKSRQPARMWHLDFARIVCVSCVVVEHSGGGSYSNRNAAFVLQWVLPYLFVTSGVCFSLSRAPLWQYSLRLLLYVFVGTMANWVADAITGRNWRGDFGNTVYQMFYVVFLLLSALLATPLRVALRWRTGGARRSTAWKAGTAMLLYGAFSAVGFVFFIIGLSLAGRRADWDQHPADGSWSPVTLMGASSAILAGNAGTAFLASLACLVGGGPWVGWILLAFIYVPRVAMPFHNVGYSHNVDLYVLGVVATTWPLAGSRWTARWVRSYWPLMFAALMLLGMPPLTGRCDLDPPSWWWERFRFYLAEAILVVAFVTGAFNTSDPYQATVWLNQWALFAYCTHVAWGRLMLGRWAATLTFGSSILFYIRHRVLQRRRLTDSPKDAPEDTPPIKAAEPDSACAAEVEEGRSDDTLPGARSRPAEDVGPATAADAALVVPAQRPSRPIDDCRHKELDVRFV